VSFVITELDFFYLQELLDIEQKEKDKEREDQSEVALLALILKCFL
jgi:hypothetical protein